MSPLPGASSRFPGVVYELRQILLSSTGSGTTACTIRRLRRLAAKLPDEEWLEITEAVKGIVEIAHTDNRTRAELSEQLRTFLQGLGSDDEQPEGVP